MDGYSSDDISSMAKNKPAIRGDWNRYMEKRRKYELLAGKKSDNERTLQALKAQL